MAWTSDMDPSIEVVLQRASYPYNTDQTPAEYTFSGIPVILPDAL